MGLEEDVFLNVGGIELNNEASMGRGGLLRPVQRVASAPLSLNSNGAASGDFQQAEQASRTVFVRNIDPMCSEEELHKLFEVRAEALV